MCDVQIALYLLKHLVSVLRTLTRSYWRRRRLRSLPLRACPASVWIMALIGLLGNVLVLGGRVLSQSKRAGGIGGAHQVEHSLYLRHLAASDLIMGVYLAVIAGVDIMYRYVACVIFLFVYCRCAGGWVALCYDCI